MNIEMPVNVTQDGVTIQTTFLVTPVGQKFLRDNMPDNIDSEVETEILDTGSERTKDDNDDEDSEDLGSEDSEQSEEVEPDTQRLHDFIDNFQESFPDKCFICLNELEEVHPMTGKAFEKSRHYCYQCDIDREENPYDCVDIMELHANKLLLKAYPGKFKRRRVLDK